MTQKITQTDDVEVGDTIKMTGVDERTGETQTKEGKIVEIDEKHNEAKFSDEDGNIVAKLVFSPFYDDTEAKFRAAGGQLIATIHTVEIVSESEDVATDGGHTERVELWGDRVVRVVRDDNGHFVGWEYIRDDNGDCRAPTLEMVMAKSPDLFGEDPATTVDHVARDQGYI